MLIDSDFLKIRNRFRYFQGSSEPYFLDCVRKIVSNLMLMHTSVATMLEGSDPSYLIYERSLYLTHIFLMPLQWIHQDNTRDMPEHRHQLE